MDDPTGPYIIKCRPRRSNGPLFSSTLSLYITVIIIIIIMSIGSRRSCTNLFSPPSPQTHTHAHDTLTFASILRDYVLWFENCDVCHNELDDPVKGYTRRTTLMAKSNDGKEPTTTTATFNNLIWLWHKRNIKKRRREKSYDAAFQRWPPLGREER